MGVWHCYSCKDVTPWEFGIATHVDVTPWEFGIATHVKMLRHGSLALLLM